MSALSAHSAVKGLRIKRSFPEGWTETDEEVTLGEIASV